MNVHTEERLIPGPVGQIDLSIDLPDATMGAPRGLALVGHPHPLFGGTKDNKVARRGVWPVDRQVDLSDRAGN